MCLPDFEILTFAIPNFAPIYHPSILYTNFEQIKPNFAKIGCFLPSFAQNTPNLCKLGAFICDENPRSLYKNPQKSAQKTGTYTYIMSMSTPQGGKWIPNPGPSGKVQETQHPSPRGGH